MPRPFALQRNPLLFQLTYTCACSGGSTSSRTSLPAASTGLHRHLQHPSLRPNTQHASNRHLTAPCHAPSRYNEIPCSSNGATRALVLAIQHQAVPARRRRLPYPSLHSCTRNQLDSPMPCPLKLQPQPTGKHPFTKHLHTDPKTCLVPTSHAQSLRAIPHNLTNLCMSSTAFMCLEAV